MGLLEVASSEKVPLERRVQRKAREDDSVRQFGERRSQGVAEARPERVSNVHHLLGLLLPLARDGSFTDHLGQLGQSGHLDECLDFILGVSMGRQAQA